MPDQCDQADGRIEDLGCFPPSRVGSASWSRLSTADCPCCRSGWLTDHVTFGVENNWDLIDRTSHIGVRIRMADRQIVGHWSSPSRAETTTTVSVVNQLWEPIDAIAAELTLTRWELTDSTPGAIRLEDRLNSARTRSPHIRDPSTRSRP